MKIIYSLLILIVFIFSHNILYSQPQSNSNDINKPIEYNDFYTYRIAENSLDTIVAIRKPSAFWFGILGGPNFDISFGDLYSRQQPNGRITSFFNKILSFDNSFGYGYFLGLMGEFVPMDDEFGYGLKIIVFDKYVNNSPSEVEYDAFGRTYNFHSNLTYLTFSPYARYTIPKMGGFHVTAGFDVALNIGSEYEQTSEFTNTAYIEHEYTLSDVNANTRFMFSAGAGYDFFMADFFAENNRLRITPFVDFKIGSNIISSYNSSWNNIEIKVGAQFKLSHDKVTYDTLKYQPGHDIEPVYVASIQNEIGVEYLGFVTQGVAPTIDLSVVQFPSEIEPVDVAVKTVDSVQIPPIRTKPERTFPIGDTIRFGNFATSASTQLTASDKEDLDALVKILKNDPNLIVRLDGHSDNRGTLAQNNARADARAINCFNYIVGKGISRGRVFQQGLGSRRARDNNDTEAGRRRNRRVEIVIQRSR